MTPPVWPLGAASCAPPPPVLGRINRSAVQVFAVWNVEAAAAANKMNVLVPVLGLTLVLVADATRSPYQAVLRHSRIRGSQQG